MPASRKLAWSLALESGPRSGTLRSGKGGKGAESSKSDGRGKHGASGGAGKSGVSGKSDGSGKNGGHHGANHYNPTFQWPVLWGTLALAAVVTAWIVWDWKHREPRVLEVTDTKIVVEKGKEKWEIERNKATKITGDVKKGSRVTVQYRMTDRCASIRNVNFPLPSPNYPNDRPIQNERDG